MWIKVEFYRDGVLEGETFTTDSFCEKATLQEDKKNRRKFCENCYKDFGIGLVCSEWERRRTF